VIVAAVTQSQRFDPSEPTLRLLSPSCDLGAILFKRRNQRFFVNACVHTLLLQLEPVSFNYHDGSFRLHLQFQKATTTCGSQFNKLGFDVLKQMGNNVYTIRSTRDRCHISPEDCALVLIKRPAAAAALCTWGSITATSLICPPTSVAGSKCSECVCSHLFSSLLCQRIFTGCCGNNLGKWKRSGKGRRGSFKQSEKLSMTNQ